MKSIGIGQEGRLEQVVRPEHGADHFQNRGVTVKATPVGMRVRVTACVVAVDGRRVNFEVSAFDDVELIARGGNERFVVDLERFLAGVQSKSRAGSTRGADGG